MELWGPCLPGVGGGAGVTSWNPELEKVKRRPQGTLEKFEQTEGRKGELIKQTGWIQGTEPRTFWEPRGLDDSCRGLRQRAPKVQEQLWRAPFCSGSRRARPTDVSGRKSSRPWLSQRGWLKALWMSYPPCFPRFLEIPESLLPFGHVCLQAPHFSEAVLPATHQPGWNTQLLLWVHFMHMRVHTHSLTHSRTESTQQKKIFYCKFLNRGSQSSSQLLSLNSLWLFNQVVHFSGLRFTASSPA